MATMALFANKLRYNTLMGVSEIATLVFAMKLKQCKKTMGRNSVKMKWEIVKYYE